MPKIISPIKCFGGKSYQAKYICKFVENELSTKKDPIYIEGFLGGANVLLNLNFSGKKYAFDIDPLLINCWKIIQNDTNHLIERLSEIKYCEEIFFHAKNSLDLDYYRKDDFLRACVYLIRNRMSRAGLNKNFGWSDRLRRGKPEYISAWETMIDSLPLIAERIKDVQFECGDYEKLMCKHKLDCNSNCVNYLDPPYINSSRVSKNVYRYEMQTYYDVYNLAKPSHEGLWWFCRRSKGVFFMSGYDCEEIRLFSMPLPQPMGKVNRVFERQIVNHASQQKIKPIKNEILWKIS